MPRGFRPIVRIKHSWHVLMFPWDADNVKEIYGYLGMKGRITCLVNEQFVSDYKRELSYLPYGGPFVEVLPRSSLWSLDDSFHTAVFLTPIDKWYKPEDVLFEVYRLLMWHGYIQVVHFIPGGKEHVWNERPDTHSIKIAALLRKIGFVLSDARVFEIVDGLWVNIEGRKSEVLKDDDIAY